MLYQVCVSELPSFLRLNNIPLYVFTTFLSIDSSVNKHLGSFHSFVIVNNAATNMGVPVICLSPSLPFFWVHTQKWSCS